MSVPSTARAEDAATAAAEPPLEPPGMRSRSHGFLVGGVDPPRANSCVFVLPTSIAPAALRRFTTVASASGTWLRKSLDPAVVLTPLVSIRSLTEIGSGEADPGHDLP